MILLIPHLATAAIAINYDNFANAAFDRANSANILAQAAYNFANTIVSPIHRLTHTLV
jgi:hypothetical protein